MMMAYYLLSSSLKNDRCPELKLPLEYELTEINKTSYCCGGTRLHHLLRTELREETLQLLNEGADVDLKDQNGRTALHVAVMNPYVALDILEMIAEKTSDVNIKDGVGKAAIHLAVLSSNSKAVRILLNIGCNLDIQDSNGNTPLHYAFYYLDMVDFLVKRGANVEIKNNKGETPLHTAVSAYFGQVRRVITITYAMNSLLNKGANINEQSVDGDTALHIAGRCCYSGIDKLWRFLLYNGAKVNLQNEYGETPLHLAIKYNAQYLGLMLTTASAKTAVNTPDKKGNYPLHVATELNNFTMVKLLLDNGAEVDSKNCDGKTSLHLVTANEEMNEPIFNLLMNRGAQVSCKDKDMITSLHIASSYKGRSAMLTCTTLLAKGASPNVQDVNGVTPLHNAVENHSTDIVKLLLENGAEVTTKNKKRETPLHISTRKSDEIICKTLLANGATVNDQDDDGVTPLHSAVEYYNQNIVQQLLENGAEVNIKNKKGETPLLILTRQSCEIYPSIQNIVFENLLANGATPNVQDLDGMTPLHYAVENYSTEIAKLLLENGAFVNIKNNNGKTPLSYVHSIYTLEVLLHNGAEFNKRDKYGRTALHNIAEDYRLDQFYWKRGITSRIVLMLLEWGASQNIKDDLGKSPSDFYSFTDAQKEYETKRTCLFSTLNRKRHVKNSSKFKDLQDFCYEEIERMKLELYGCNSLYDIFRHYEDPMFLSNKELESEIHSEDLKVRFPVYCSMLTSTYHRSRERVQLFDRVVDILQTPLPFEVMRYILTFVDDDSLRNVIKAKEDLEDTEQELVSEYE